MKGMAVRFGQRGLSINSINVKYPYSYYKSQAESLHTRFLDNLKSLRDVTNDESREIYISDLHSIHQDAYNLYHLQILQPLDQIRLKHILDRDVTQHVAISRHNDNSVLKDVRH